MALPMKMSPKKVVKGKCAAKVARGRCAKALVLSGRRERTAGGLKADMLMRNRSGKVVSKRASAAGRRNFAKIEPWLQAVMTARECLRVTGFVAINGRTLQGKALYVKSRAIYGSGFKGTEADPVSSSAAASAGA